LWVGIGPAAGAEPRPIIGIPDYYSIPAPPISVLLDAEPYAADVGSGDLIRAGGSAITVLPRTELRAAERKLAWRTHDALDFNRLQVLGQAIQADRLVVGWITRMTVYRQDFLLFASDAAVTTQVFDVRQGRVVWQRDTLGSAMAGDPDFAFEIALERAVAAGIRAALPVVSAPVDRTLPPPQ
jgi:hypothetical protein